MESDIHDKLDELKKMQQQLLRSLERLAGKIDLQDDWLDTVAICEIMKVKDRTILRWRKIRFT